ncbi:MAG: hypothetical protein HC817_12465 [Saprospiraceae bacterium]|nr:hypothetical protein [Saprospiraceae bacterium]
MGFYLKTTFSNSDFLLSELGKKAYPKTLGKFRFLQELSLIIAVLTLFGDKILRGYTATK